MKSIYTNIADNVCRNYGLENPITIAVMTMIQKLVEPSIIIDMLDEIDRQQELVRKGIF